MSLRSKSPSTSSLFTSYPAMRSTASPTSPRPCGGCCAPRSKSTAPISTPSEATGGYERHVLEACVALGLACHRAHGARVRHFAKYLGLIAKTDPIDAYVLALYGLKTEGLRLYQPPSTEEL